MRIHAQDTMAIFIDYQEKLIPVIHDNQTVVKNAQILLQGLRQFDLPIILTRQYPQGIGNTIPEMSKFADGLQEYDKVTFSCYETSEIKGFIDSSNKKNIIVCGTEAHICVLQTIIDLQAAGYQTIVVEDCVGSRTKENKKIGVNRAIYEGSIVATYESILFELVGGSKAPAFKTVSKLIK